MNQAIQRLIVTTSILVPLTSIAAPRNQVILTTKANQASTSGKIELNAIFDTRGETNLKINDPKNPNKLVFDQLTATLASFGSLLPGAETGPNRYSVKILFDSIQEGIPVSVKDQEPALISRALDLHEAFAPYWKDYSVLSTGELVAKYKSGLYTRLSLASSRELSRFIMCTSLDYQANVVGAIRLPPFVQNIVKDECAEFYADVENLEKAISMADSKVYQLEAGEFIFDYPDYWSPSKFSKEFELCDKLEELDALVEAGWIERGVREVSAKQDQCRNFVAENILQKFDEAMTLGMNSSALKSKINPYYRSILLDLLQKAGAKYQLNSSDVEREVAAKLKSNLILVKGFSKSELQSSFFNTEAFMKAIQKPVDDPMSLIVLLLSSPESRTDSLRRELAAASEETQVAYIEGLVKALGKVCLPSAYSPSCIYAGVTKIDAQQASVTIQSGLESTPVWSGYVLFPVAEKKVER